MNSTQFEELDLLIDLFCVATLLLLAASPLKHGQRGRGIINYDYLSF